MQYLAVTEGPYVAQACALLLAHPRTLNTAIFVAEVMGGDTLYSSRAAFVVAVGPKDCVPAFLSIRQLHGKPHLCYQIDCFLLSASTRNAFVIADGLLSKAKSVLPQTAVLMVSTRQQNKAVFDQAGFVVKHRVVERMKPTNFVMIYTDLKLTCQAALRGLDGRNVGQHWSIWSCNGKDCWNFGAYECPEVHSGL